MQLQIKLPVQIGLTVSVNDLLRMLTGERSIVYWVGIFKQHSVNKIAFIVLRGEFETWVLDLKSY